MNEPLLDFVPAVFLKVLAVTLALVLVDFAVAIWVTGPLAVRDIIGTLISAAIFTYLIHLWIVYAKDR